METNLGYWYLSPERGDENATSTPPMGNLGALEWFTGEGMQCSQTSENIPVVSEGEKKNGPATSISSLPWGGAKGVLGNTDE